MWEMINQERFLLSRMVGYSTREDKKDGLKENEILDGKMFHACYVTLGHRLSSEVKKIAVGFWYLQESWGFFIKESINPTMNTNTAKRSAQSSL